MKRNLITILQFIIFLGLGVAIIVYMSGQLSENDKAEMRTAIKSVRLWMLIPIFIVGFFSHYFRALRWKLLLEPLKIHPSSTNTLFAVLVGYIANLAIPRAGEVAKCTVLARYEKVPTDKMVGTIVAERAFDILCLIIVTITACLLQADIIGSYAHDLLIKAMHKRNVFFAVLGVLAAIILAMVLIYRGNRESKAGQFIKNLSHGISSIFHMKKRWEFIGYTFLIWLMYLSQVYIGLLSLPATSELSVLAALVVLIFGSLGMITTQGGIGAYALLVSNILMFYNIDKGNAQAFGWVAWALQTAMICILGILALILLPIYNKTRNAQTRVDTE